MSTLGISDPTILEGVESYYDKYGSGFGEVMTLFSDESTISKEVPFDYEKEIAIYDDYCDDMYAIKIMITMKLVIMILIFNWIMPHMIVILLSLLPLLFKRRDLLMWRVIKFLCLWIMKRMLYVMVILMNLFMMLLKIIMREELMMHDVLFMFQFLSFMRASLKSSCLAKRN